MAPAHAGTKLLNWGWRRTLPPVPLTQIERINMKINIYTLIILVSIFAVFTTANAQNSERRPGDRYRGNTYLAMMGSGGMMGGGGMMGNQGIFNGFGWPQRDTRVPRDENQQDPNLNNQRIHKEKMYRLQEKIQQKRKELSSLYRSGTADKAEINEKIDELNNLERDLDD
jgi:Spy/CpxP family protein refolding chaperone